jgi:hypothetical protein
MDDLPAARTRILIPKISLTQPAIHPARGNQIQGNRRRLFSFRFFHDWLLMIDFCPGGTARLAGGLVRRGRNKTANPPPSPGRGDMAGRCPTRCRLRRDSKIVIPPASKALQPRLHDFAPTGHSKSYSTILPRHYFPSATLPQNLRTLHPQLPFHILISASTSFILRPRFPLPRIILLSHLIQ